MYAVTLTHCTLTYLAVSSRVVIVHFESLSSVYLFCTRNSKVNIFNVFDRINSTINESPLPLTFFNAPEYPVVHVTEVDPHTSNIFRYVYT